MKALPHPLSAEVRVLTLRDIAWLTVSFAIVAAPHALRAPWWLTLLTLCLYAWRFHYTLNRAPLPSRWLVLAVAAIGIFGVWIEYRSLFGRQPGVVLLLLFSGLKLLESRTHRDGAVAAFLAYFLIITNFLYTQTILTAALMGVGMLTITLTLVGFSAPERATRENLRTAGVLLAQAVPAAVLLFLLFPRVQGPLWGMPQDAFTGITGLSETMSPGNLARVAQSDAMAFRAAFQGQAPAQAARYWRGPVMWDFDGRTWSSLRPYPSRFTAASGGALTYSYTVTLEPHNHNWMFALETPVSVPENAYLSFDGQILAAAPVRSRMRYDMVSALAPRVATEDERSVLIRALRLPPDYNPRARALAAEWRSSAASDAEVLARAIAFIQDGGYGYTLEPPLLGVHSVDEFLFSTKSGFCEHFSSAFVFLMRAAGVPARVVTGYQGGELNPVDRIITVRQSDAHAWSEVFLRGRGWVRVDPTAAAAPGRIEIGLARALPQSQQPGGIIERNEWLRGMRYRWEAIAHQWNVWVLGYSPERQRDLMLSLGMRDADWRALTATLFTALGLMTVALLAWSLRRLARPDPVHRAWQAFCRKLAARGVERSAHEGPRDYSMRAASALPRSRRAILRIGALYIGLRYGRRPSRPAVKRLARLVRELRLT